MVDRDKLRDAWGFVTAVARTLQERSPETAAAYPAVGVIRLADDSVTVAKLGRDAFRDGLRLPDAGPVSPELTAEIMRRIPEEERKRLEPTKLIAAFRAGYAAERLSKGFSGKPPPGGVPF